MEIKTIQLPCIRKYFDPYMLDPLLGMYMRVENNIIPLSRRKIRDQDIGKQKDFKNLLIKFYEEHERKKVEKENYDEKIRNSPKRPRMDNAAQIRRFNKVDS